MHESANVDERKLTLVKSAGLISINDVPKLDSTCVHLAGISDTEFDMALMKGLKSRGYSLSTDMQSFVRHVTPVTRDIEFSDVANKKEIAAMMDKLKLDIVEAKILTGTDDLEKAGIIVESWGCPGDAHHAFARRPGAGAGQDLLRKILQQQRLRPNRPRRHDLLGLPVLAAGSRRGNVAQISPPRWFRSRWKPPARSRARLKTS